MKNDLHTPDMFAAPLPEKTTPGAMNYSTEVSRLLAVELKDSQLDRFGIAEQMSHLSGDLVSKNMIDAWASPARTEHNAPFYRVPLLETVLETHALTDWIADKRGGAVEYGRGVLNIKLGELEIMKGEVARQIRQLKRQIGIA